MSKPLDITSLSIYCLSAIALIGFVNLSIYNVIDVQSYLVILLSLIFLFSKKFSTTSSQLIIFIYLLLYLIVSLHVKGNPIGLTVSSLKPFILSFLFSIVINREFTPKENNLSFGFVILFIIMLVKYVAMKIISGHPRPGAFTENNFEIGFVLIVFTFALGNGDLKRRKILICLCGLLVIVSMSKSAIFILTIIIAIYALYSSKLLIKAVSLIFTAVGLILFFILLPEDISQNLDRLKFANIFLSELTNLGFYELFFGSLGTFELNNESCKILSYYSSLMIDGRCFSNILHSMNLRLILDHGLVFSLILLITYWKSLSRLEMQPFIRVSCFLIPVLNGFSVSGLGNPYIFFALFIIVNLIKSRSAIKAAQSKVNG